MERSFIPRVIVLGTLVGMNLFVGCRGKSISSTDQNPQSTSTTTVDNPVRKEAANLPPTRDAEQHNRRKPAQTLVPASESPPPVHRWAIISFGSLRQSGFPDLVTSVIGNVEGVELVERDQLASVLAELDLSRMQTATGGRERQRLSALIGAQRLLLLDGTIRKGRATITVQVIDTYLGVHLFRGQLKLDENNAEAAAQRLAKLTHDIEKKYADGVRAVVGIPEFISRSSNEDYDSLQKDFADILAAAVKTAPGVAVLSLEEAQLIQNEMAFSGHTIRRYLPLFVTGEYKVYEREANDKQRFQLSVVVTDGSETSERIEEDRITLQEAQEMLASRVAESIFDLLSRPNLLPLTREQQEAMLAKRADELIKAGEILKAIQLRETALLIAPNNPRHRIQIFLDRDQGGKEYWDLETFYPHLEYLLRNRLIDVSHGFGLIVRIPNWIRTRHGGSRSRASGDQSDEIPITKFNDPRAFLLEVFPQLQALPAPRSSGGVYLKLDQERGPLSREHQQAEYAKPTGYIVNELLKHSEDYHKTFPDDFAMLIQLTAQDVLPDLFAWTPDTYLKYLTKEEVLTACQKTRTNGTARDIFIADFLEFRTRLEADWDHLTEDVCDELAPLEQDLASLKKRKKVAVSRHLAAPYEKQLAEFREKLARRFERAKSETESAYPKIDNPLPPGPEEAIEIDNNMSITWIKDWPIPADKKPSPCLIQSGAYLAQLDATTDVVWSSNTVYLMNRDKNGALSHRRIYEVSRDDEAIFSLHTDGENLWLANTAQQIIALPRNGKKLAEFRGGSDLPAFVSPIRMPGSKTGESRPRGVSLPHHRPSQPWQAEVRETAGNGQVLKLALYPLAPGKCLACGREGDLPNTWIALLSLERQNGKPKVEVLHRAERRFHVGSEAGLASPENTDICFSVPWICVWENPDDSTDRVVIVGRTHDCDSVYNYKPNMPLAVDLRTKKVTTLAERLPGLARVRGGVFAVSLNGSLVVVDSDKTVVWHWQPDGDYERVDVADSPTQDYFLPRIGNRVYSVGEKWLAIDIGSEVVVTTLAEQMKPGHAAMDRYASSACFGIWALESRQRVPYAIDPGAPLQKSVSPFAKFVRPEKLQAHDKAVAAIRKLGGYVGTADSCRSQVYMGLDANIKKNCTAVCLDKNWQGGDEGLRHLSDLSHLKIVFLLEANVTPKGLGQVLARNSMTCLALSGMPLDHSTLEAVARLPRLQALFLDLGADTGPEFDEECLTLLARNKHLEVLSLHGPAFTDRCLPSLKKMTNLRHIHLWGTSLSLLEGNTGADGQSVVLQLRKGKQPTIPRPRMRQTRP